MPPLEPRNADRWKLEVLDELFTALASSTALSELLVYKGARVLRLRLGESLRASYDIDACLSAGFSTNAGGIINAASLEMLRKLMHTAISSYFESQEPVRYAITDSTITPRRKIGPHPRGWDVYWLEVTIHDYRADIVGIEPKLRIDVATAENISEHSISELLLGRNTVMAVTLERIAGEKLRAFLSCLPTYRKKISEKQRIDRRVKDLYDLVRIARKRPFTDVQFWIVAAGEFRLACESRCIDCAGLRSFMEDWSETQLAFAADKTLPNDVAFQEVETTVQEVVSFLEGRGFLPFQIDLPEIVATDGPDL